MARVLIVGCGCRGQALARSLRAQGHAVRGTTRGGVAADGVRGADGGTADAGGRVDRRAAIEAAGAEVWIGDPDRIATISGALDGVTVLCWLMGSATGSHDQLAALHGPRLRMLLGRTIDTTVRGLLYEAAGSVPADLLAAGAETVNTACSRSEIPHALLRTPPEDQAAWLAEALARIDGLLTFSRR